MAISNGILAELNSYSRGFLHALKGIDQAGEITANGRTYKWMGFVASQSNNLLIGMWVVHEKGVSYVSITGKKEVVVAKKGESWDVQQDYGETSVTWDDLTEPRWDKLMEAKAEAFRRLKTVMEAYDVRS